jgi:hypothetical protein
VAFGKQLQAFQRLERFVNANGAQLPRGFDPKGEEVIGWYANPFPHRRECLVLTKPALHYRREGKWFRVAWSTMLLAKPVGSFKHTPAVHFSDESGRAHRVRLFGRRITRRQQRLDFRTRGRRVPNDLEDLYLDSASFFQVVYAAVAGKKLLKRRDGTLND